ncbi:MAG: hypothetical protein PHV16_00260 [Candidatus Nanoarchaeia archaeon]|nr:hypothetical protein [Candidatus Nanoarchaeia archaeon]
MRQTENKNWNNLFKRLGRNQPLKKLLPALISTFNLAPALDFFRIFRKMNASFAIMIMLILSTASLIIPQVQAAGTVWHPADQVTAGTFDTGNFTFQNYLFINESLGIGTTEPNQTLVVNGTIAPYTNRVGGLGAVGQFWGDSYIAGINLGWYGISDGGFIRVIDDGWIGLGDSKGRIVFDDNGDYVNILDGNVGIGTTSPSQLLHINGSGDGLLSDSVQLRLESSDDPDGYYLEMGGNGFSEYGYIQAAKWGTDPMYLLLNPSGGNVGIGTTSPTEKLSVNGNASINNTLYVTEDGNVGINTTTPDTLLTLGSGTNQDFLKFNSERPWIFTAGGSGADTSLDLKSTNNDKRFRILSGDSIVRSEFGIGPGIETYLRITSGDDETGQNASFYLRDEKSDVDWAFTLDQNDSQKLKIGADGSVAIAVETTGNVGIGTLSPTQKLDVNGSVNVSGASAKLYSPEICLDGDCKTGWPTAGGTDTLDNVADRGATTDQALTIDSDGDGQTNIGGTLYVNGSSNGNRIILGSLGVASLIPEVNVNGDARSLRFNLDSGNSQEGWQFYNDDSDTSVMMIQLDGDVGIGTETPVTKLDVVGSGSANNGVTIRSGYYRGYNRTIGSINGNVLEIMGNQQVDSGEPGGGFGIVAASDQISPIVWMYENSNNAFQVIKKTYLGNLTSDPALFTVRSSGNVGIGTTSPDSQLEVNGSFKVTKQSNDAVLMYVNQSTGNVGIGTETPEEKLDVLGNIKVSSYNSVYGSYLSEKSLNSADNTNNWGGYLELTGFTKDTSNKKEGSASLTGNYPASTSDWAFFMSTNDFGDLTDFSNDNDFFEFWLYLSNASLFVLGEIELGNTQDTSEYYWKSDDLPSLSNGWNKIILRMGDAEQDFVDWSTGVDHFRMFFKSTGNNAEFTVKIDDFKMVSNRKSSINKLLYAEDKILTMGNVGINTTEPTDTLEVNGNIKINETGYIHSGGDVIIRLGS